MWAGLLWLSLRKLLSTVSPLPRILIHTQKSVSLSKLKKGYGEVKYAQVIIDMESWLLVVAPNWDPADLG